MQWQPLTIDISALVVTIAASIIDLRTTKIPNKLTFPAAAVGIIMNFVLFGWKAGLFAIAGWFTGAIVMVGFNMVGNKNKMGFGDAKLIAAVGAFIGLKVLIAWGYFALLYGGLATLKFLSAFPWSQFGDMVKSAILGVPTTLEKEAEQKLTAVMNKPIALAPYIAAGTLLAIILEKPTLAFLGFPAN